MAESNSYIANLALQRAGATKRISDLGTDTTVEALFLRDLFGQFRDELLESHDWPFARRRVVLAPLADVTRTDWGFVYATPTDMLNDRGVVLPGVRNPGPSDLVPYRLEAGDPPADPAEDDPYGSEPSASIILCDLQDAELIYTGRCTNPGRFSPSFTACLYWRLALDVALYLTKKDDLARIAAERVTEMEGKARAIARNQGQGDLEPAPEFMQDFTRPT